MTEKAVSKRFPIESFLIMSFVVGLMLTVTAVSIWFNYNPPGGERQSMFEDDPNMTNSVPIILIQQSNE